VMRNLMNTCPEYKAPDQNHHGTCAAIEYAVTALKVPLLMVMGRAVAGLRASEVAVRGSGQDLSFRASGADSGSGCRAQGSGWRV